MPFVAPADLDDGPPLRSVVQLVWTGETGPDLWTAARRVEGAMRMAGRGESCPERPARRQVGLATYRWAWPGDEIAWLCAVLHDLFDGDPAITWWLDLTGGPLEPDFAKEGAPPPAEDDDDTLFAAADAIIARRARSR